MTKTITFKTRLDTKRETAKAYKITTGSYLPKSIVTIEILEEVMMPWAYGEKEIPQQIVMVTMPEWFAKKL